MAAQSSAKSEFWAMVQRVSELLWLEIIPKDLKIELDGPLRLYCNNQLAISITHNLVQHNKTKHIKVDRHFIKENRIVV